MSIVFNFIKRKFGIIVLLTGVLLFLGSYKALSTLNKATEFRDTIGGFEADPDIIDYHFLAVNFAFAGQFPVEGYLLDTGFYKILPYQALDELYLSVFRKNGPVLSLARPPLYPLIVGCIYKIFGYEIYYNQWLNILLLSLIIGLLPLVGYKAWGRVGYFSGIVGALVFMVAGTHDVLIDTMDITIFFTFVIFIIASIGLFIKRSHQPIYWLAFGIIIGIGMLTKPMIVALPFFYSAYLFLPNFKKWLKPAIFRTGALFAGVLLVVLPYTIFINRQMAITEKQRGAWIAKIASEISKPEFQDWKDFPPCTINDFNNCYGIFRIFIKTMLMEHSTSRDFILISNTGKQSMFIQNNEMSVDGAPQHFEWMFVKNSFYKTHDHGQSTAELVFLFYYHHPLYLLQIPIGRVIYASSSYPMLYWLVTASWSLCVIQRRIFTLKNKTLKQALIPLSLLLMIAVFVFSCIFFKYTSICLFVPLFCIGILLFKLEFESTLSVVFPILCSSLLFYIVVFYGDDRYIKIGKPLWCIGIVYFTALFVRGYINYFQPQKVSFQKG